jgi:hypothetical protein
MPPTTRPPTRPDDLTDDVLRRVLPRDAQGYAKSRGWMPMKRVGHLMVFNRPGAGSLDQVLVPTDTQRPDFVERMFDVVERLARFESRSMRPILVDLLNFDADVLRYRVASPRIERGTLPLTRAIELLNGAKQSLLSAAHSVLVPKKHHPKLSRTEAMQLLDACQMEQTEQTSFVVAISCPLHAVDQDQAGVGGDTRPFARRSTSLLVQSLAALNNAIEEDRINSIVDETIPLVSANLCEALLKMRPADEDGVLEFIPSWASSTPMDNPALLQPVSFSGDEFESIEDVYRQLRPVQGPTAKPWIATIDKLLGTEDEGGMRQGEVAFTLFDVDDGEVLRAKASLTVEQYDVAYRAHNPSMPLVVVGELSRGPRVSRLSNVTSIRLAQLDDIQPTQGA